MPFIVKKVKTEDLAEYLCECRKHVGLTQNEVANLARIQPKFLCALEEGRLTDLPDPVYVKGFLRSLSQVYRINTTDLIRQYDSEMEVASNLRKIKSRGAGGRVFSPRFVLNPRIVTILTVCFVMFVGLGYLYFQVRTLKSPPELTIVSPAQDITVDQSLLVVRGKTESGSQVFFNNQPIVVDADGEFVENLSLAVGTNVLLVRAVNKFGQEQTVARTIVLADKKIAGTFQENELLEQDKAVADKISMEIEIVNNAAWIEILADAEKLYSGTMLPGSRQEFEANEKITITTGNAGSTKLKFNGQDLGMMGQEGEVLKSVEFAK